MEVGGDVTKLQYDWSLPEYLKMLGGGGDCKLRNATNLIIFFNILKYSGRD